MILQPLLWFLSHQLKRKRNHNFQSPFVQHLASKILPHRPSPMGLRFEQLRRSLLDAQQMICFEDLGAGFGNKKTDNHICKSLGYMVRRSACRRKEGELLLRLAAFQQPQRCLELGTHLGFSALYQLAGASEKTLFTTIEGARPVAELAASHFKHFGFSAKQYIGDFDQVLPQLDLAAYQPDWVLLDGNHRYDATIRYAEQILPHMPTGSLMILDDIYWSAGMRQAWLELIQHPRVSLSVDLFEMGLLFIEKEGEKGHFWC